MFKLADVLSKEVYVLWFKRIIDGGVGAKPPAAGRFFVVFWKKSCFNAIN